MTGGLTRRAKVTTSWNPGLRIGAAVSAPRREFAIGMTHSSPDLAYTYSHSAQIFRELRMTNARGCI